ncbi:LysR family transcriptional regulator [Halomonas sp. HNIBRBA4712]|uniref:LysR family transcriptional regulator n=1 Tax=Halomonas sp. HNIBRBA4712 TaxID=3373087 RepID=UPI00374745B1
MPALDDLAFFQQLARARSLTETARSLGLSLSAVSKRLKQLEARLGVTLVARTTRKLTLTPEGERYLARGALILEELAELESRLADTRSETLSGPLRINATFGFGRTHIAPLLSRFCHAHPELQSWLELTNFPVNLADQGFDIGIRVGEPPDSRLIARPLLKSRRVLCAAPDYVARMPALESPQALTRHECLVVQENGTDFPLWRFEPVGGGPVQAVKVGGRLSGNDAEVITRLALDGHGVMLRSWWDVHAHLQSGALTALLPGWQGVRADFIAVYEARRHVPARVRAFIDYLEQELPRRVPPLPESQVILV